MKTLKDMIKDLTGITVEQNKISKYLESEKLDLQYDDLYRANLKGTCLRWAVLKDANLCWADLRVAVLKDANLCWAVLKDANLEGANLEGANLEGANLEGAKISKKQLEQLNVIEENE